MMKKFYLRLCFIICALVIQAMVLPWAAASINGVHGRTIGGCPPALLGGTNYGEPVDDGLYPGRCVLYSSGYVPKTGNYTVLTQIFSRPVGELVSPTLLASAETSAVLIDSTKRIDDQNLSVTGSPVNYVVQYNTQWGWCQYLVSDTGVKYLTSSPHTPVGSCGDGYLPIPPEPPVPEISCTINNGNALSVSLGTIERSELPTTTDSGNARSIPFDVKCTGGDVTVNMKLKYSSISLGSSQAVKTSTDGVGVAILYKGEAVSTTETTPINLLEGSNTMNLSFLAVRDSSVEIKDIVTGAFTASAILELTQQ